MEIQYLYQWVNEENKVMVLKLNDNNHVVCYAILHETDYDPLNNRRTLLLWIISIHTNPIVIWVMLNH